ncbi:MAG: alpha/beta hydrolase [Luteitalea sp.]
MFRTIDISDPRFESDGLRLVTVKSAALRGRGDVTLWAPAGQTPAGLVILLHGVYRSHWCWALRGGAHRTAARLIASGEIPPLALAMPSDGLRGDGTAYLRHGDGAHFSQWISDDVPVAARAALPSLDASALLFIAGLSMGGFGALRLGATHAARVRGISGHSSITHLSQMSRFVEEDVSSFGTSPAQASVLDAIVAAGDALPPLRFDCGVDDQLIEENRALHRALDARGIRHTYEEFPGTHEWSYWETHIEDTFRFFGKALRG